MVLEIDVHVDKKAITLLLLQFLIHVLTDVVVLDELVRDAGSQPECGHDFKFRWSEI